MMSDGGFLSPINPCHGRTYVEDEVDKIVAHINARTEETIRVQAKLPASEQIDVSTFAHRCACLRDEIDGGLHR